MTFVVVVRQGQLFRGLKLPAALAPEVKEFGGSKKSLHVVTTRNLLVLNAFACSKHAELACFKKLCIF